MKILIIEDEQHAANHLKRLLYRYDPEIEILAVISTAAQAVQWLKSHDSPELVFLDIQLADALSFKIFDFVDIPAPVIFTTAYDQYALRAFKVHSIDYLLKPVDLESLTKAFQKLKALTGSQKEFIAREQIQEAFQMFFQSYKKRFVVKLGDRLKSIPVENIYCFFSKHKTTYLYTKKGKAFPIDYSLNDLEGIIDPELFFRINRQYVVQLAAADNIVVYSNSRLKIKIEGFGSEELVVSRDRVGAFKEWLGR